MKYEVVGNIYSVPLSHILVDPDFNCRGWFTAQDVYGLGQAIKEQGQREPVLIQPIDDVMAEDRPVPCTWQFRLVAGHRRYMAIDKWTDKTHIKCVIEEGLNKEQAEALNLTENLQRNDMTIIQEAKGIERTWGEYTIAQVARLLGQSRKWVEIRRRLLELPDYVQKAAAAERLGNSDIEKLTNMPSTSIEAAFRIMVKPRGLVKPERVVRGSKLWKSKPRPAKEIDAMLAFLLTYRALTPLNDEEVRRVAATLAWVRKRIDAEEFLTHTVGFPAGCAIIDDTDKILGISD